MRAWLQAARLPSAVNLQLPLLFGQTLAYATHGAVSAQLCLLLALYGLAMQLFIVFLNDWADRQADDLNETPTLFSGGSRVLVERRNLLLYCAQDSFPGSPCSHSVCY